jgi:soluble lytic murein transglycosylase
MHDGFRPVFVLSGSKKPWWINLLTFLAGVMIFLTGFSGTARAEGMPGPACPDPKTCFLEGLAAFRDARYEEAIAALEQSLRDPSGWEEYSYFYLLRSHRESGRVAETLGLCKIFQNRFPESPLEGRVDLIEAEGYRNSSALWLAGKTYENLMERRDSADLRLAYGEVLESLDRLTDAHRNYQVLRKKWPRSSSAREAKKRVREIEEKVLKFRARMKQTRGLLEEADLAMRARDWPEALSLQERMLSGPLSSPLRRRVLLDRVRALVYSGKLDAANELLEEQLVGKYPRAKETAEGIFSVGRGYWRKDLNRKAYPLLEQFVDEYTDAPEAARASYILGRIHVEEGELDEAIRQFRYTRFLFPWTEWEREAAWWEAWSHYRRGDYGACAELLESLDLDEVWVPALIPRSRYWRSRSVEKAGNREQGRALYRELLERHPESYYALLARRRLESEPAPAQAPGVRPEPPGRDEALLRHRTALVLQDPALPLLLEAGLRKEAVERLNWLRTRPGGAGNAAPEDWVTAYCLAGSLPGAMRAAYRGGILEQALSQGVSGEDPESVRVLSMLYPLPYWDLIREQSAKHGLDPYLVAGLIRQESLFQPEALSRAGALGLMQIMPSTGKMVAGKMGMSGFRTTMLLDPEVNIRIGTAYLGDLLDRYGTDWHKILANYNAGPRPVAKWTADMPGAEPDEFVENILYRETRLYVKKVLFNREVYRNLYGKR